MNTRTPSWTHGQPRSTPLPTSHVPTSDRHDYQPRHPETVALASRVFSDQTNAGRAYGAIKGYVGKPGGWIYTAHGRVLTQGWASLAHRHVWYDKMAKGYRFGALALRRLDDHLDGVKAR